ncbi:MAG: porin [bacterium]|nr:porin [bacterium]
MKKILLSLGLTLGLLFCGSNFAQAETVESGKGTFKLGGVFQAGFLMAEDDACDSNTAFTLNRARLLAEGKIGSESVKWYVEADMLNLPNILEAKITFPGLLPMTDLSVGRLAPNFTHYFPMPVAKLDFINYPRLVDEYGMGYQCGLQSTTNLDNGVSFNVGVFNGADVPNNFADNNDAFDFFVRAAACPMEGLDVAAYHWQGSANDDKDTADEDSDLTRTGIEVGYQKDSLRLLGEYTMGKADELESNGYYVQALYKLNDRIEVGARYDGYDPNTDADNDEETWITVGGNHYIYGNNAMCSLNYIIKDEEADIDNDVLKGQVQVSVW